MTPANIYSPKGQDIRNRAKTLTKNMLGGYINGRLGLVIDGTGKDYEKIEKQAIMLQQLGYDVAMIFVNTDKETALQRNKLRPRSLPDAEVSKMWSGVQKNMGKFQRLFGNKMFIVDNSEGSNYQQQVNNVYKKLMNWSKVTPKSKAVTSWINAQKGLREEMAGAPTNSVAAGGVAMPPDAKYKPQIVIDRRRKKDKQPVLLKRFRKHIEEK